MKIGICLPEYSILPHFYPFLSLAKLSVTGEEPVSGVTGEEPEDSRRRKDRKKRWQNATGGSTALEYSLFPHHPPVSPPYPQQQKPEDPGDCSFYGDHNK